MLLMRKEDGMVERGEGGLMYSSTTTGLRFGKARVKFDAKGGGPIPISASLAVDGSSTEHSPPNCHPM